ncbi:MBL fold metallo-hydrolase [Paenactinomyces guangxiensis]|uniref:MBL fold metallo-hydrolase n=1 Tax=Paenactinomyces guangxiensis TaxID=1490290 RepID=A0A7W1WUX1_9BACL|nr:MBL fold metallo-hydrolase [Paenactinomyces guangxiensis]MBA4496506.1 MBL fold metallo-hydrolase [Paenactinomyces guangxiensis]MBH8593641.1 MBL fold metallo-hydrolase [Paenactinomyces guangxiensis]
MRKIATETREVDGVHALRGSFSLFGFPFFFCTYVVDGLMIDTGPVCARRQIRDFASQLQLQQVVLTHWHEDHSGNAAVLAGERGIPVCLASKTAGLLSTSALPFYRRLAWGDVTEPVTGNIVDRWIETPRHRFRVVETPGHSEDHICLVEEDKGWVFAGDLFLATRLNYGMKNESVRQMIESIKKILSYPVEVIFCGHAGVVKNGRKAFEKKLHYLEWLREETVQLAQAGCDPGEITRKLLPRQYLLRLLSQGEMSPAHLIHSILEEEGCHAC